MQDHKENAVLKECLQFLHYKKVTAWRNNNAGIRRTAGNRTFWTFKGQRGASDIFGVLPGGYFLAVECKADGKGPTADQLLFLAAVRELGGLACVVHNSRELERELTTFCQVNHITLADKVALLPV